MAVDVGIELVFTNNVVNANVGDHNASCISLECGGEEVQIDIIMADD